MNKLTKTARKLRKESTPWENKLWYEFLRNYEFPFHRQKVIGNFIVDFYCSKAHLAIELDGSGHYSAEKQADDKKRAELLNESGVEVLRFSNLDIDKNFYGVCTVIDKRVKEKTGNL